MFTILAQEVGNSSLFQQELFETSSPASYAGAVCAWQHFVFLWDKNHFGGMNSLFIGKRGRAGRVKVP